ncbi:uncharacterized protein LOC107607416 [Arachis ipaensis]|uniref:uncharacterized protein LOC107607416 n=1 Tax=Arachis ipaensis TaxID=130454 RepID=UPI0007AF019A|nr:uncharacterized protein LOC107607416 [Arachis ipaensis]
MANLANTMEVNAATTLQAIKRLGQTVGNRIGNGNRTNMETETVHPPTFRESTNPTEVENWFQAMECALQAQHVPANQYVEFMAYQLLGEAKHGWQGECQLLRLSNAEIPWDVFQTSFYRKYFPDSGAPESYESWKCIMYPGNLRDAIMNDVAPLEIRIFSELVIKARAVKECAKKVAVARDTRGENNNCRREKYFQPRAQNFNRGGHIPQGQGNFRRPNFDPYHPERGRGDCLNCGLPGHMVRDCIRGRNPNAGRNQHQGRVFAVNTSDAAKADPLIRGWCIIGYKALTPLCDIGIPYYT